MTSKSATPPHSPPPRSARLIVSWVCPGSTACTTTATGAPATATSNSTRRPSPTGAPSTVASPNGPPSTMTTMSTASVVTIPRLYRLRPGVSLSQASHRLRSGPHRWKAPMTAPKTMFDKVWNKHVVHQAPGEPDLLYVDLHLVHEVTSPQAFAGLRLAGRRVRRPDLTLATIDHGVPTTDRHLGISDPLSRAQIEALIRSCKEFGITLYGIDDPRHGIVHVIGPEQGISQPGMTIVCGDSHTATHGALGALAIGIGTSEVEHVLATQVLPQVKPKTMAVEVNGQLHEGVVAKDVILSIIRTIGVSGGIGHVIEYRGDTIQRLSMEIG